MAKKIKRCLSDDGYWKRKPCNAKCEYYDTCIYRNNEQKATERLTKLQETEKYFKESNRHDKGELQIMQGYSLERKIQLTCERIYAWYDWWDGNVYIGFSGGKDSTVLKHLVHEVCGLTDVPCVFVNTGLEFDSVREKGLALANEVLQPEKSFVQVIKEYGYPIASKEVAQAIYECQKPRFEGREMPSYRVDKLLGKYIDPKTGEKSSYNMARWGFLLDAPFRISHMCCKIMKKKPSIKYEHSTGRKPIMGMMASESRLRASRWMRDGCNAFYNERPTSMPMSFWTEQDVLLYIKKYGLKIPDVYGDIVRDEEIEGQMSLFDFGEMGNKELFDLDRPLLKTTGEPRTGCTFCLFSIGSDPEKLLRLKAIEPQKYDYVMRGGKFDEQGLWIPDGGLGYKFVIDWLNEHGNMNIRY